LPISPDYKPVRTALHRWQADAYVANAGFVPALGEAVIDWLKPQAGEAILDLGCGDGALTLKLVEAGAKVTGIDGSDAMVAKARERGIEATQMDGRALGYTARFDAVFTNAALHWMKPAEAVARGVFTALKPGGRYAGEFGGFGNVASIQAAARGAMLAEGLPVAPESPWYFPTVQYYEKLLTDAGFSAITTSLFARPTLLPTGLAGWLETFGMACFPGADEALRPRLISRCCDILSPVLQDSSGNWIADYVRLRFIAHKAESN
jgi:trans-aconitate methyltransferase